MSTMKNDDMVRDVSLSFGQLEFLSSLVEHYGKRERKRWLGGSTEDDKRFLSDLRDMIGRELTGEDDSARDKQ